MTASPAGAVWALAGTGTTTASVRTAATSDPTIRGRRLMAHLPVAIKAGGYHPTHRYAERLRERNAHARRPRHADGRAAAPLLAAGRRRRPARRASNAGGAPHGGGPRPL